MTRLVPRENFIGFARLPLPPLHRIKLRCSRNGVVMLSFASCDRATSDLLRLARIIDKGKIFID